MGGNQRQCAPASVFLAGQFRAEMGRDARDVFHDRDGVFEHEVIDALKDVADARARLVKHDAIGVVNVAATVWLRAKKLAEDLKLVRNAAQVVF